MSVLTGLTLGEPCRWICFADGVLQELGARKRSALLAAELADLESWLLVELGALLLVELGQLSVLPDSQSMPRSRRERRLLGRMDHRLELQAL